MYNHWSFSNQWLDQFNFYEKCIDTPNFMTSFLIWNDVLESVTKSTSTFLAGLLTLPSNFAASVTPQCVTLAFLVTPAILTWYSWKCEKLWSYHFKLTSFNECDYKIVHKIANLTFQWQARFFLSSIGKDSCKVTSAAFRPPNPIIDVVHQSSAFLRVLAVSSVNILVSRVIDELDKVM